MTDGVAFVIVALLVLFFVIPVITGLAIMVLGLVGVPLAVIIRWVRG